MQETCYTFSKLAVTNVKVVKPAASFLTSDILDSYLHSGFFYHSFSKKSNNDLIKSDFGLVFLSSF